MSSQNYITTVNPHVTLTTDASMLGWGAVCNTVSTGGFFTEESQACHINVVELKAVLFGLKALCGEVYNVHIKVLADNTTAVHTINNRGSCRSVLCDTVVQDMGLGN